MTDHSNNQGWRNLLAGFRNVIVFMPAKSRLDLAAGMVELAGEVRRQALVDLGETDDNTSNPAAIVTCREVRR